MKALFAMTAELQHRLFTPAQLERLTALVDIDPDRVCTDLAGAPDHLLRDLDLLITGWGAPLVDASALLRVPRLRAIVHTAGTTKSFASDAVWSRADLVVTTAAQANAVPVAEYTLAEILLAGKRTLRLEADYRQRRRPLPPWDKPAGTGNYGAIVGLIGASRIGRLVAGLLRPFDP